MIQGRLEAMAITLTVNGDTREYPAALTGAELLTDLDIPAGAIVAELNGTVVRREEFLISTLGDGDVLELVTVVGGG